MIACFPDKTGFALGSIEGRVAIHHVDEKESLFVFYLRSLTLTGKILLSNVTVMEMKSLQSIPSPFIQATVHLQQQDQMEHSTFGTKTANRD